MNFRMLLAVPFCTARKLQDSAAACLIFITVAALDTEGCRRKLIGLLHQWIYVFFSQIDAEQTAFTVCVDEPEDVSGHWIFVQELSGCPIM